MPKTEEQFKKAVAIITARGGSKRIPHKNIRDFCGRPILSYSIRAALESGAFDEVMVSTADDEIVRVARQWGAAVPFLRSQDTSGDYASTDDVILEVIRDYEKQGIHFERFCCLYPTAPFLTAQRLREAMALLDTAESVMPVVAFSTRSQDLEKMYHDCGQFYACRTDAFLRDGTTDVADLVPIYLTDLEVQDIDTEEDWEIAELKYRRLHTSDSAGA